MDTSKLQHFFDCCLGHWDIQRTYHYLTRQEVERSRTNFEVKPLTPELQTKVLMENQYDISNQETVLSGFQLSFHTVSEKGEEVAQSLNALFVPKKQAGEILEGDYLRDRAYEEDRPIVSQFRFDPTVSELLMTTPYTQVVSVDSITLVNPNLRIRKIINYDRPPEGEPLKKVRLVGFGVEQKVSTP